MSLRGHIVSTNFFAKCLCVDEDGPGGGIRVIDTFLVFMQMCLKLFSGMTNSVDPYQTAPKGAV